MVKILVLTGRISFMTFKRLYPDLLVKTPLKALLPALPQRHCFAKACNLYDPQGRPN